MRKEEIKNKEHNYIFIESCGFDLCECREDDNCGCSYPNNMLNYELCPISDELCQVRSLKK